MAFAPTEPVPGRFYGEDLACIHEAGYGGFAEGCAAGLLAALRAAGIAGGKVVDLGCGPGAWAGRLVEAGYDVLGVDLSAAMIRLARRRAPRATFRVGSLYTTPLPPCRAITALGEVLCYRVREAADPSLVPLFRRAHTALGTGGLLIFDVAEVGLDRGRAPACREGEGWACLVRFAYDDARQRLTRHITTFRRIGASYRRREETHHVQLYRASAVARELREAGFRVRTVRRFGEYPLPPGRVGFLARKA